MLKVESIGKKEGKLLHSFESFVYLFPEACNKINFIINFIYLGIYFIHNILKQKARFTFSADWFLALALLFIFIFLSVLYTSK